MFISLGAKIMVSFYMLQLLLFLRAHSASQLIKMLSPPNH